MTDCPFAADVRRLRELRAVLKQMKAEEAALTAKLRGVLLMDVPIKGARLGKISSDPKWTSTALPTALELAPAVLTKPEMVDIKSVVGTELFGECTRRGIVEYKANTPRVILDTPEE